MKTYPVGNVYLIEMPFITIANRADPDQAAAWSGSTLVAYGNMIKYDPTLVDLTRNVFVLCTKVKFYKYNYSYHKYSQRKGLTLYFMITPFNTFEIYSVFENVMEKGA